MELLVFGHGGKTVLFFPTRMARFYDYENWGIVNALSHRLNNGELQLICVDSVDTESFYNQHIHPAARIQRHLQYEAYILNEVLPLMRHKSHGHGLQVAGCSMGAYHAINIAFRHPTLFNKVTAMSGRYDLTQSLPNFKDLFDGYHNETIYFNMPAQYTTNLHEPGTLAALRHMDITLAVGQTDPFVGSNQYLSQLLWSKHIPHQFYIWDNYAHRPRYWRQMVQLYL
ncbi:esterase family protein [Mucilaginibacter sp. Bleaf8]|nr:esterase family protein [Mucilaginibacter sp. Bleaf8]